MKKQIIGASNEFFLQHNLDDAVFEIVVEICLKDEPDIKALRRAATEAIRLYPELGYRPVMKDEKIVPADNPEEVVICESGGSVRSFGSDDTNGYLFYITYSGRKLVMRFFHGMADYVGLKAYIKSTFYFYYKEKGIEFTDEEFLLSFRKSSEDMIVSDEEDMYDPYRKYGDVLASSPIKMIPGTFQFEDNPGALPYNTSHIYDVMVSTSDFAKKVKEYGTSFAPFIHYVVCEAMCKARDVGDAPYVSMLPVDFRRFFGSKNLVNCSDAVMLLQTAGDRREDTALRCAKLKKQLIDSLNADYAKAVMGDKVRQVEEFNKKSELPPSPAPAGQKAAVRPFSFGVTYPGVNSVGGGIDEFIEDMCCYGMVRISMVAVSTFKDNMHFKYNLRTDDSGIVRATCDVLNDLGIPARITDEGNIEKSVLSKARLRTENIMELKYTDVIETTGGKIRGYYDEAGIRVFKGIPYAEAPVGERRFKPAEKYGYREGIRDCTEFGKSCWQNEMAEEQKLIWTEEFVIRNKDYSEDCLTLNIWAPEGGKDLPVVLYLYGGGFVTGGSSCDIYDGDRIAERNAIYVTLTHREGCYGWLASKELSEESPENRSGNYTLSDEEIALLWIKENIAAFGGDPGAVTIWGQSSGASQVNLLAVSEQMKPYYDKVISMGMNCFPLTNLLSWQTPDQAYETSKELLESYDNSLEKLRQEDAKVFCAHMNIKAPVIDGYYVKDTFRHEVIAGVNKEVPMLMGMVGRDFIVTPMYNLLKTLAGQGRDVMKMVIGRFYPNAPAEVLEAYDTHGDDLIATIEDICTDAMLFELLEFARVRNSTCPGNTYIYFFTHVMPGPDADRFGSFHSCEVPYCTGYLSPLRKDYWKDEDRELAVTMNKLVCGFFHDGKPGIDGFEPSDGTNLFLIDAKEQKNIRYSAEQLEKWRHFFGVKD